MDHLQRFVSKVRAYMLAVLLIGNLVVFGALWLGLYKYNLNEFLVVSGVSLFIVVWSVVFAYVISTHVTKPLGMIWQAVLHVAPGHTDTPAPNVDKLTLGREIVTSLSLQVYQLASVTATPKISDQNELKAKNIINSLPVPMFVMDKDQNISFANEAGLKYINRAAGDVIGKNVYSILDLSFSSESTFDNWLNDARAHKLTDRTSWDRVRLKLLDRTKPLQFDMAAYYNKNNPSGAETLITFFDHTTRYGDDDDSLSFIALTVHELRTPLTLLRGYIEVFEDELSGKLDPEMNDFLNKMQVASQQLTAFVNNILNVARVEADQLTLQLHEEKWADIITSVVGDLNLRAKVQNRVIECQITDSLPTVAADRVSIYEVLVNLLDNAIKYNGQNQKIIVKAYLTQDGMIETIVQDFGVGIPPSVLPNLFEKFYRNFKTKANVGGTGLGLYLCKAIISAHGGNIWVKSKEGEGAIFGFTLKPYSQVAAELKTGDNKDIVRAAHGWIKNHSLYRR